MVDFAQPATHHCPALHRTPGYATHLVAAHALQGSGPLLQQYDLRLRGLWGQLFTHTHRAMAHGVVALWLDERGEALVDGFGADSVLLQGLASAVAGGLVACCLSRLPGMEQEVRCRPLPRLEPATREALGAAGLVTDEAGVARHRFATITVTTECGCGGCVLRGECPRSADS